MPDESRLVWLVVWLLCLERHFHDEGNGASGETLLLVVTLFIQVCFVYGVVLPLRVCGKPPNSVEVFRSGKAGAEIFAACKEAIIEGNIKPAVISVVIIRFLASQVL